jgi:hypothetical protein
MSHRDSGLVQFIKATFHRLKQSFKSIVKGCEIATVKGNSSKSTFHAAYCCLTLVLR